MDKIFDVIFDPKVIAAALIGWTLRDLLARSSQAAGTGQQMAGTLLQRQANVATQHATKRITELVDERTKRVVDSLLPKAKTKAEAQIVQLQLPGAR